MIVFSLLSLEILQNTKRAYDSEISGLGVLSTFPIS